MKYEFNSENKINPKTKINLFRKIYLEFMCYLLNTKDLKLIYLYYGIKWINKVFYYVRFNYNGLN